MANHKIGIIGAGPVGSIMAAYLARNGEDVHLIDIREDLISAVEEKGISLTGAGEDFQTRVTETGCFVAELERF